MNRALVFNFKTESHARTFVHRLALNLRHVAIYIEDARVLVLNGGADEQRKEIYRYALMSGADRF